MRRNYNISTSLLQLITSEQAYHYRIIPVNEKNGTLKFKSDKISEDLKQELQIVLNKTVELIEDTSENIQQYLSVNFRQSNQNQTEDLHYSTDFLEKLLLTAKDIGSSDIHFEPYEHKCRVRFRLDGKLKEQFIIPLQEYPVIVNKLKIKAGLDISEKRLPQDGRITIKTNINEFDIRVSSLPTLHGEKIVLRILSKDANHIQLEELGFTEEELKTAQKDEVLDATTRANTELTDKLATTVKQRILLDEEKESADKQQLLADEQIKSTYAERVLKDKQAAKLGLDNVRRTSEASSDSDPSFVYTPNYEE